MIAVCRGLSVVYHTDANDAIFRRVARIMRMAHEWSEAKNSTPQCPPPSL